MQIDKIRMKGGTVSLEWTVESDAGTSHMILVSHDAPQPSFKKAMDDLAEYIVDAIELPKTYVASLDVVGVTFKLKDGRMGATMSARRRLTSGKTMSITTPLQYEASGNEKDKAACLLVKCVTALRAVQAEAQAYLRGERAQLAMFGETTTPAPSSRKAS